MVADNVNEIKESPKEGAAPALSAQMYSPSEASSWRSLNTQTTGGVDESGTLKVPDDIYTAADLSRAGRSTIRGIDTGTADIGEAAAVRGAGDRATPAGSRETANRAPTEARDYQPTMTPHEVKPGETLDSLAKARFPDSSWQQQAYTVGIMHANGIGSDQVLQPGSQIKLPDVQSDGSVVSRNGTDTLVVNKDQSYSRFDSSTGKGTGRDADQKTYTSEKMPDGSIQRTYPDLSQRTISPDGMSGTGRDSSLRKYTFTVNDISGAEDRSFANGAQQRVHADGTTVYKGPSSDNPKKSVFELRNAAGDLMYRQPLTAEENKRSLSEAIRAEAVAFIGDGTLISGKGRFANYMAGSDLLKAATSDVYARAGGGEAGMQQVTNLHDDIQKGLRKTSGDPGANFTFQRDMHNGHEIFASKQEIKHPKAGFRRSYHPYNLARQCAFL